jgi:hypothetical protein
VNRHEVLGVAALRFLSPVCRLKLTCTGFLAALRLPSLRYSQLLRVWFWNCLHIGMPSLPQRDARTNRSLPVSFSPAVNFLGFDAATQDNWQHVNITVTMNTGGNAVVSGVFFD